MRKTGRKPMAGGIVALSLILTGTGYAYWTDTLNVTTKATTGDLEVTFADLGLYAQYANETKTDGWSIVDGIGDTGYVADDFFMRGTNYNTIAKDGSIEQYRENAKNYNTVDFNAELVDAAAIKKDVGEYTTANTNGSDQIEITVNKMYPGYAQAFRTDILNVGDIAAKLSNVKFTVGSEEQPSLPDAAKKMLGVAVFINQEQYHPTGGQNGKNVFKLAQAMGLSDEDYFTVGGVEFVRLSALENADPEVLKTAIANAEILCSPATDNRMDLFMGVAMDPDADGHYTTGSTEVMNKDNNDADSQEQSVKITMDLDWDQFNVGKDTGNVNILAEQNR